MTDNEMKKDTGKFLYIVRFIYIYTDYDFGYEIADKTEGGD